jgi:hypothetical protein
VPDWTPVTSSGAIGPPSNMTVTATCCPSSYYTHGTKNHTSMISTTFKAGLGMDSAAWRWPCCVILSQVTFFLLPSMYSVRTNILLSRHSYKQRDATGVADVFTLHKLVPCCDRYQFQGANMWCSIYVTNLDDEEMQLCHNVLP